MKKPLYDSLKEELDGWKLSLKIREITYKSAKIKLKEAEEELKVLKRITNQSNKQKLEAKKEVERLTKKLKVLFINKRYWAKTHMNKVFEQMESAK